MRGGDVESFHFLKVEITNAEEIITHEVIIIIRGTFLRDCNAYCSLLIYCTAIYRVFVYETRVNVFPEAHTCGKLYSLSVNEIPYYVTRC